MEKIWIREDKSHVPVEQLTEEDLVKAFDSMCRREYIKFKTVKTLFNKIDTLNRVKDMLQEEALRRNITLKYPDETEPDKWDGYFGAERRTKAMPSEAQATLATPSDE